MMFPENYQYIKSATQFWNIQQIKWINYVVSWPGVGPNTSNWQKCILFFVWCLISSTKQKLKSDCLGHCWAGEVPDHHHCLLQGCDGLHTDVWRHQWGVIQQCSWLVRKPSDISCEMKKNILLLLSLYYCVKCRNVNIIALLQSLSVCFAISLRVSERIILE